MNKQKRTRARGEFNYVVLLHSGWRRRPEDGYLVSPSARDDPPLPLSLVIHCCSKGDPLLMRIIMGVVVGIERRFEVDQTVLYAIIRRRGTWWRLWLWQWWWFR